MSARGDDTRARLVQATADVVRRLGYARATTRAIAEAAGVAEGTIYRHFPHKQQLFLAAVMERNQAVVDAVAALPGAAGTGTVRENVSGALHTLARLRDDMLPMELALMADPDLVRERRRFVADAAHEPGSPITHLATYLGNEQRLGRVRPDMDAGRAAVILLATLFGTAMLAEGDDPSQSGILETAVDMLLLGMEPRP
jgi:AcrR family transcriptional regulator